MGRAAVRSRAARAVFFLGNRRRRSDFGGVSDLRAAVVVAAETGGIEAVAGRRRTEASRRRVHDPV